MGTEGVAVSERSYQAAAAYAPTKQGTHRRRRSRRTSPDHRAPRCASHADDDASQHRSNARTPLPQRPCSRPGVTSKTRKRTQKRRLAAILTPISKAWATDLGVELTSSRIQIHGGSGYIEETGVAQFWRDSRIAPIYEGTNGIQAQDLAMRRIPLRVAMRSVGWVRNGAGGRRLTRRRSQTDRRAPHWRRRVLGTGGDDLRGWLAEGRYNDVLAGATLFLKMMGDTPGRVDSCPSRPGCRDRTNRVRPRLPDRPDRSSASFYAEHVLSTVPGLTPPPRSPEPRACLRSTRPGSGEKGSYAL